MPNLYIVNATRHVQKISLWLDSSHNRMTTFMVPSGGQELMDDAFTEADKVKMIQHIERFGGLDISETNKTPPGFAGLAYRWDRPAKEPEIEAAHEVDMTRREKMSAGAMVDGVKAFDGRARRSRGVVRPQSMITETEIQEVAPVGEAMPSGGLYSKIIGDVEGGRFDVA